MGYRDKRLETHFGISCWYCDKKEITYYEDNLCTGCGAKERIPVGLLYGVPVFDDAHLENVIANHPLFITGRGAELQNGYVSNWNFEKRCYGRFN